MNRTRTIERPAMVTPAEYEHASKPYAIVIEWSDCDQCYVATIPDLPHSRTGGATRAEAICHAEEAIGSVLATLDDIGLPHPGSTFTMLDETDA